MNQLSPDCSSCLEGLDEQECPSSKRDCGHHCNCSWSQDACCWCSAEFGEEPGEGESPLPQKKKYTTVGELRKFLADFSDDVEVLGFHDDIEGVFAIESLTVTGCSSCETGPGSVPALNLVCPGFDDDDGPERDFIKELDSRLVAVCSECRRASCWQGTFFCDKYRTAGIVAVSRGALRLEGRENAIYYSDYHLDKMGDVVSLEEEIPDCPQDGSAGVHLLDQHGRCHFCGKQSTEPR